jgi:hypothetical protein
MPSVGRSIYDCLSKANECRLKSCNVNGKHRLLYRHLIIKKLICSLCTHQCIIYYLVFRINKCQAKRLSKCLILVQLFQKELPSPPIIGKNPKCYLIKLALNQAHFTHMYMNIIYFVQMEVKEVI